MKKIIVVLAIFVAGMMESNAQSEYTFSGGIGLDLGSGSNLFGLSAKYFLTEEHAAQGELLFENGLTVFNAFYEYNGDISDVEGLNWFAGGGLSVLFIDNFGTEIALRPIGGVEYKINGAPLTASLDWRPFIGLGDVLGNEIGSFGVGLRYIIQ